MYICSKHVEAKETAMVIHVQMYVRTYMYSSVHVHAMFFQACGCG